MELKTNFQMVSDFNELIGNAKGAADLHQVRKQLDLIRSEFKELEETICSLEGAAEQLASSMTYNEILMAQQDRDEALTNIRDGIADVLVTTYGLAHRMGIDADKDMEAVQVSNMSKFFTGNDRQAAEVAYALSDTLGIAVECRVALSDKPSGDLTVWAFVSADDSDPERPRGKLLKAPGFKQPVFD